MTAFQCMLESPFRWVFNLSSGLTRRIKDQVSRWREALSHRHEPNG